MRGHHVQAYGSAQSQLCYRSEAIVARLWSRCGGAQALRTVPAKHWPPVLATV